MFRSVRSHPFLRRTAFLSVAQFAMYGLSFIRNLILARTLAKADFALASVFALTISALELGTRMSFGQQIIQSNEGSTPQYQATSHCFQFLLSTVSALLLAVLSIPIARAFDVPHLAWAFALLGLIPFVKGLEHLDVSRFQRDYNYVPHVICDLVPQLLITVAAWPLATWLGDFRAVVWLILAKGIVGAALTHLVAERRYRWDWHPHYVGRMWSFGGPLLLNGFLIIVGQQADQAIVGSFFSLEELAPYALVVTLVGMPWSVFTPLVVFLMLPVFSKSKNDMVQFRRQFRLCMQYVAIGTVLTMVPLILIGDKFIALLYGERYAGNPLLIAFLCCAGAMRFLRLAPTVAALAQADTKNQLYANIWRSVSLPLAIGVALLHGNMVLVAVTGIVAELCATASSIGRLSRRGTILMADIVPATLFVTIFVVVAVAWACFAPVAASVGYALMFLGFNLVLAVGAARIAFPTAFEFPPASVKLGESTVEAS